MSLGRLVLPALAAALLMLSGGVANASLGTGVPRSTSVGPTSSSSFVDVPALGRQVRRAVSPAASPTAYPTITFSEVPLEEFVTNQYEDDGVIFTSTVQTSEDSANPTSPVLSGYPRFEGAIEGYFVDPSTGLPQTVSSFTLDVGYINNRDSVVVEAFDSSGNEVQSVLADSYGINLLTVTYAGMASFSVHEIAEEPAGFAIDNLTIDPTADPTPVTSVASMGDSYSSGQGLLPGMGTNYDCGTDMGGGLYYENTNLEYLPGFPPLWGGLDCDTTTLTNTEPNLLLRPPTFYENTCHRDNLAYPVQIASMLNATESIFVACSGATTANIGAIPETAKPQYPHSPLNIAGGNTQLTDVENFSRERLGGQDPSLITIGIGGNDAGFSGIAEHCIVTITPCSSDGNFVDTVLNNITGPVYERLEETFTALRYDFPNSTIVAFGYPSPISASAPGCNGLPLYQQDKEFLATEVLGTLNQAISEAAEASSISYVNIAPATAGHEICTAEPWFRGLSYPIVASFHPTQFAHDAIAAYFREHYTNGAGELLIHNPPVPVDPIRVEPVGPTGNIGNLQGGAVVPCGSGCEQSVPCIQSCSVQIQGSGYAPGAQLEAVLHSTPYDLGPVTVDNEGNVEATLQIPAGVPAGEHVITLEGTAPDGSPQYGALGLEILEAPGVAPPVPSGGGGGSGDSSGGSSSGSASPSHGVLAAGPARGVRASVRLHRHGQRLLVTILCPRAAASTCSVSLALHRSRRIHGHVHTILLATKTVRVPAGRPRTVTIANPALLTASSQLRLTVVTATTGGRVVQSLTVGR
ncbi:MAG TPA: SGNH/GDSL hydrolase family protein [Solirubrobacteraceae bacterium]|nr:SGNH/GDSL hydrolase family protein [Solirubrobacteraceae bacterium]